MSQLQRFEELIAWQKARELTRDVYIATRNGPFAKDFGLSGQIQRAGVSIMSNIAEGFERNGHTEFYHFLGVAKASCAELRSQLYVALDAGYLDQTTFDRLFHLAEETAKVIGGLRTSVGRKLQTGRSKNAR
jgi:four helix bundle protein